MSRPLGQQGSRRYAEGGGGGDEVVDVAAAAGAFGAAEGSVGQGAAKGGAALGEAVLGEPAQQSQALDVARGVDSGGAYFYGTVCHDR
ncbi:hypothetical protein [Streptomyces sp. NRRL F-5755]|uniref:hypothetical protein n=1 Tax=Streptomyces sp. NRRL F-5755 TaxID=1519475 RepID=UPI0013312D24|nr:hypothetical protein [Streptomyces sp. NRRL F-5755]